MKYFYRVNTYGTLDSARNKFNSIYDCLQCSAIETWEHIIQCKKIEEMRLKFIIEMYKELKSIQKETITNEILWTNINDIRKYLRNVQDINEYETNQTFLGMKQLFQGYAIIA